MGYPNERKEAVLKKMFPPNPKTIKELSQEEGICEATLYHWRKVARAEGRLLPDGGSTPLGWSAADKFAAVVESAALNEVELSEYCRRRGLYPEQIQHWREACEQANGWDRVHSQRLKDTGKADQKRIQALEREAQAQGEGAGGNGGAVGTAKKSPGHLGGGRGRMMSPCDRQQAVGLIEQAVAAGATMHKACEALQISPRTYQRWTRDGGVKTDGRPQAERPQPANQLTPAEREQILMTCNQEKYRSLPPSQRVPALADEGIYIASESSFYRVLKQANQLHHRGQAQTPKTVSKPTGYQASAPNQVWSWDITYLATTIAGLFYRLYLVMDIFSRKIVGWEIHRNETAEHASRLIRKACLAEGISGCGLVLHADNGSPMKGATMLATLQRLGVVPSFSRPSVSNDNPYSESLFGTMKYTPAFPSQPFESLTAAREWVHGFVTWYNHQHRHSGTRFVTPAQRHEGTERTILDQRKAVYEAARQRHPQRWSGETRNWSPVGEVWLNPENPPATPIKIRDEAA